MPAPTIVQSVQTAWNSATTPKTTSSFSVVAGDRLAAFSIVADDNGVNDNASISGGSLTWAVVQRVKSGSHAEVTLYTATVDVDKSMTVTFAIANSPGAWFGGSVINYRNSDGFGASSQTTGSGAPTLNLTTTQANSSIMVANGDWAAIAGARTWRSGAGSFVETGAYPGDGAQYGAYGGYHADAGAIATYAVGVTAPAGQTYSIAALEVKGSAVAITAEQEGYRWRNDDGSESAATWKVAQDTTTNLVAGQTARLRFVVNTTGDTPTERFKLQYRKVGDASWRDLDTSG